MKKMLFAIIICIPLLNGCMSPEERKKEKEREVIEKMMNDEKEFATRAYVMSQDFVRQKLKSPSTAIFSRSDYTNGPVFSKSVEIKSYVDSQNGFGATIRTNYRIRLEQIGEDWSDIKNWKVSSLSFE